MIRALALTNIKRIYAPEAPAGPDYWLSAFDDNLSKLLELTNYPKKSEAGRNSELVRLRSQLFYALAKMREDKRAKATSFTIVDPHSQIHAAIRLANRLEYLIDHIPRNLEGQDS